MIKVFSKIFEGDAQLSFTRIRLAEAMLDIRHDLELFKVGHNVTKYQICSMILQETEVRKRGLPYKRLMGMCRCMGSHFHDWFDYHGVAFSIELREWGRTFFEFWGKTVLHIYG